MFQYPGFNSHYEFVDQYNTADEFRFFKTKGCTYWHLVAKIIRTKRGKNKTRLSVTCVSKVPKGLLHVLQSGDPRSLVASPEKKVSAEEDLHVE